MDMPQVLVANIPKIMKDARGKDHENDYWQMLGNSITSGSALKKPFSLLTLLVTDEFFAFMTSHLRRSVPNVAPTCRGYQVEDRGLSTTHDHVDIPDFATFHDALAQDHPFRRLYTAHSYFAVIAYDWVRLMAEAGAIETAVASVGQYRPIIRNIAQNGPLNQNVPTETEYLAVNEWSRRLEVERIKARHGFNQPQLADYPEDAASQRALVEKLQAAAVNEADIIDRLQYANGRINPVIKEKREMWSMSLSMFGWSAMVSQVVSPCYRCRTPLTVFFSLQRTMRDMQLGIPGDGISIFTTDFVYHKYDSFMGRFKDVKQLFRVTPPPNAG